MNLPKSLSRKQGFTLIEMMIVVVVISILAGLIIPRIMGAPARARDVGRISQLNDISLALQNYYNDNSSFPTATTGDCLSPTSTVGTLLVANGYFLTSNFPYDPSKNNTTGGYCTSYLGSYYYQSLSYQGIADNAFILVADVENDNQANSTYTCLSSKTTVSGMDTCIDDGIGSATDSYAVFVLLGGI